MKKDRFFRLVILIAVILIVFATLGITLWKLRFAGKLNIQMPAPEFCLRALNGKEYDKNVFYGKKLVLLYLRSSCPYCIKEFNNTVKLSLIYDPMKIQFVAVIDKFKKPFDNRILVLIDSENMFKKSYHITFTPAAFLIDENGFLRAYRNGYFGYKSDSLWISKFIDRKEANNKP